MATHRLDINAGIAQDAAQAQSAIFEALAFATLCDRFGHLSDDIELPQAGTVIQLDGPHIGLARDNFGRRGAAYAVTTMVASCEQYLGRLVLTVQVAKKILSRPERTLTAERFLALRHRVEQQGRSTNVIRLVAAVVSLLGATESDLPSARWLSDIYAVRNCLVHRDGVVDEVSAPSGYLRVTLRRLVLMAAGVIIEKLGHRVEEGDVVSMGYRDVEHEWRVGERVDLTLQDCADVAHSLVGFVNEIVNLVDARLGAMGGRSPAEPAASPPHRRGHARARAESNSDRRRT